MKKITLFVAIVLLFVLNTFSQNTDSNQINQEKFIDIVKSLEESPLEENAKEKRSWALKYSDEIETLDCNPITNIFLAPQVSGEVLAQYLIKLASFSLENPNNKDKKLAQYTAVESALKVYEVVLKSNTKTRTKYLDILVAFKKKGKLKKELDAIKCKK